MNNTYILTLQNSIRVVESVSHTLESKGSVRHCCKGHIKSIFSKTLAKTECFKEKWSNFSNGAFFINITIDSVREPDANFDYNRDWLAQFIFLVINKMMLIKKLYENSREYAVINFECRQVNDIILQPKKWTILHAKILCWIHIFRTCSWNIHQFWAHCFIW